LSEEIKNVLLQLKDWAFIGNSILDTEY